MSKPFSLGASERLKSRKLIESVFGEGKSFHHTPFRVGFKFVNGTTEPLQAGFTVSSRNFKKAVDRNRIKRLMREAYRQQKNRLRFQLEEQRLAMAVFFIYTGRELPAYSDISTAMNGIIERLIKKVNEKNTAGS